MKEKENGAVASVDANADDKKLQTYFAEVFPNYDRYRVFPSKYKENNRVI